MIPTPLSSTSSVIGPVDSVGAVARGWGTPWTAARGTGSADPTFQPGFLDAAGDTGLWEPFSVFQNPFRNFPQKENAARAMVQ